MMDTALTKGLLYMLKHLHVRFSLLTHLHVRFSPQT